MNYYKKDGKFCTKGICSVENSVVRITELPIGSWTDKYKEHIENLIIDKQAPANKQKKQFISSYRTNCTEEDVDFSLVFSKNCKDLDKALSLVDSKNTGITNLHMYNEKGTIQKYSSAEEILEVFYEIRLKYYVKRREFLLKKIQEELDIIQSKVKFITAFVSGDLEILNIEIENIIEQLDTMDLFKVNNSYDYLINMQIRSLTKKRIEELKKQEELKKVDLNNLNEKTPKDLWKIDLLALQKMLKKC